MDSGADAAGGGAGSRPGRALIEALSPLDADTAALLYALSHQLRTPLTSVLGYLELLTDGTLGPVSEEQERVLHTVSDAMARLAAFIDDLEPSSRAGRG
jgi:signal transduction histidine kinase